MIFDYFIVLAYLNKLKDWIKYNILSVACYFKDHIVVDVKAPGYVPHYSDGYDRFGRCTRCKKWCHKDTHMYGDDTWRIDGEPQ